MTKRPMADPTQVLLGNEVEPLKLNSGEKLQKKVAATAYNQRDLPGCLLLSKRMTQSISRHGG